MFGNQGNTGNYNNQGNGKINTNTTFETFYSDANALQISGWNKNLSLAFKDCTGTDANGLRTYDGDSNHWVKTSITPEKAAALVYAYDKCMVPAIQNGEAKTITVLVGGADGKDKAITVGYDGSRSFIRVAWGRQQDGTFPSDHQVTHIFEQCEGYTDYNLMTAEKSGYMAIEVDLERFMDYVRNIRSLGAASAHGIRHDNASRAAYANNRNLANRASFGGNYSPQQQGNYQQPQQPVYMNAVSSNDMYEELPFN